MNSCVSFVRTRYVALAVLIPLVCATTTTARTWSDKSGKFRVDAEFVKVEDDVVSLKRTDTGATIQVPLARLSEADREHVRGLLDKPVAERRPQAPTLPS